ncbi:MAG: hypothetical protein ACQES4_05745 [Bacillota bacterium]
MKYKGLLIITTILIIFAFFVGCADQDVAIDEAEDENAFLEDKIIESTEEDEANDNNDREVSDDLSEAEAIRLLPLAEIK